MLRGRDVRLYNFYPLVPPSSFGQSVKRWASAARSLRMLPGAEDSLFSTAASSSAHIASVPGAQAAASEGVVCVRTVEALGERQHV